MHEAEGHIDRSNASRAEQAPVRRKRNIVKNTILSVAALGAAGVWSVAVAA